MGGALPGPAGGGGCTGCIGTAILLFPFAIVIWLDSNWGFLVALCLYASLFVWGIRMGRQKRRAARAKPVDVAAAQAPKVVGGLMRLGGAPAKRPPPT